MMNHIASAGVSLARRAISAEGPVEPVPMKVPGWAVLVILAVTLAFLPLFLFAGYTLGNLMPTLAMVEDPNPPVYDPVSLNEDSESVAEDNAVPTSEGLAAPPKPITSSLRTTNRLLYGVAGWRSYFRGLLCSIALNFSSGIVAFGVSSVAWFIPNPIGALIVTLCLVQLSTAWVHIVISQPISTPFWRRLPPLRKTFEATCFPVLINWLATTLADGSPEFLRRVFGMAKWDPAHPNEVPTEGHAAWKWIVIFVVWIALSGLVAIPAHVLVVRVQASLLPPEVDAIIPFDRSFGGKVEPAIVGGKGYVGMKDALVSIPRSTWIRLYILYVKVFVVSFVVWLAYFAVVMPIGFFSAKERY